MSDSSPKRVPVVPTHSEKLLLVVLNEDAEVQMIEVLYKNLPDDIACDVKDWVSTGKGHATFEGPQRNEVCRSLMVAIGVSEPRDSGHRPTKDWSDGQQYEAMKKIYDTVPVFYHRGWLSPNADDKTPAGATNTDVLVLYSFY